MKDGMCSAVWVPLQGGSFSQVLVERSHIPERGIENDRYVTHGLESEGAQPFFIRLEHASHLANTIKHFIVYFIRYYAYVAFEFAEIVRELRTRLGITQERLAQELQVSFATLNGWE